MPAADSCLVVTVPRADADVCADELWCLGAVAIEERGVGGAVTLVAGFADDAALASAVAALAPRWPAAITWVGEAWRDAWRAFAQPVRVGRLLVRPAWVDAPAGEAAATVVLDPGRAFGDGSHPTTRMALAALDGTIAGGERVLDVGCGSGVLAIAAAVLGAAEVVAVDVDAGAVATTAANALANGVADRVTATTDPVGSIAGTFDVVVANLGGTQVVVDLAADLRARLAPGGRLVVGGLLPGGVADAVAALDPLRAVGRDEDGGWVTLTFDAP